MAIPPCTASPITPYVPTPRTPVPLPKPVLPPTPKTPVPAAFEGVEPKSPMAKLPALMLVAAITDELLMSALKAIGALIPRGDALVPLPFSDESVTTDDKPVVAATVSVLPDGVIVMF